VARIWERPKSTFEKSVENNWLWFRGGIRALLAFKPLASARLDAISNELAAEFASYRLANDMQVSTVNSSLRVLRRILRLAVEWGATESVPKISLLLASAIAKQLSRQSKSVATWNTRRSP
jgi:hypothetical protein